MTVKATPRATQVLRTLERVFLVIGIVFLSAYFGVTLYRNVSAHSAVKEFQREAAARSLPADASSDPSGGDPGQATSRAAVPVDTSSWSDKRIRAYRDSLNHAFGAPLAVLSIPKIHL